MEKSIDQLNRNTSLKNGGYETDADAMNHFIELVLTHIDDKTKDNMSIRSEESKYNMLANMLCFEDISEELEQTIEARMADMDKLRSIRNLTQQEAQINNLEESVAIKR